VRSRAPFPTLLLVDDEPDIRTIARLTLQQGDRFRVVEASSGHEALTLAGQLQPDLVLLDVMMAGMDGPAVLAALRANPLTAGIPVIFLTAQAMPEELDRLRALGARAILTKPFDPATFPGQVADALESGAEPARPSLPGPAAGRDLDIVVDLGALGHLQGLTGESGRDIASELVELFAAHTPAALGRMRALAPAPAPANHEVERLAHSLKSSAAMLGALTISSLAQTVESLARDGDLTQTSDLLDLIQQALTPTLVQLEAEAQRLQIAAPATATSGQEDDSV